MAHGEYRLDMDVMFAIHNALRRDLGQVARIAQDSGSSPARGLHAVRGWEIFKKFLDVHHTSEDEALWPALRARAAGQPDQLALVDALEAEHAVIDPLIASVDAAAADTGYGHQRFAERVDELVTALTRHLEHEESDGLDLIDALLTYEEWMNFATVQRQRVGDDRIVYLPWLLEEASEKTIESINKNFPEKLLAACRAKWQPDYAALNRWEAGGEPRTSPAGSSGNPSRSGA